MVKMVILLCLGMSIQVLPALRNNSTEETVDLSALFYFDEAQVYTSVAELSALEGYVKKRPQLSLADLQNQDHPLISEITFMSFSPITLGEQAMPPFTRAVILGFCAGPLGVLISIDMAEGKKAKLQALGASLIGMAGTATIIIAINIAIDDFIWGLFN